MLKMEESPNPLEKVMPNALKFGYSLRHTPQTQEARGMKLSKRGLLACLLALMLLFSAVQAGAADSWGTAPKSSASAIKGTLRSLASVPGITKIVQGKKVTYIGTRGSLSSGKRLQTGHLTRKAPITSIALDSIVENKMGLDISWNAYSKYQPLFLDSYYAGGVDVGCLKNSDLDSNYSISLSNSNVLDVIYFTDDPDEYLYIEALKAGTCTITVRDLNSNVQASKTINVAKKVPFSSMAIGELTGSSEADYEVVTLTTKALFPGDSARLLAIPRPYTATYYDCPYYDYYDYCTSAVNFTSSNPKVAVVGAYGRVSALMPGTTIISAAARDGSKKKASITLNVEPIPMTTFALTEAGPLTMLPGATHQLSVNIAPNDYYNKTVVWTSSDPSVAKVDDNGLVTAVSNKSSKKKGTNTVVITAKSDYSLLSDTISVTVSYNKTAAGATYRFYGIGNSDYEKDAYDLPACADDVNLMAQAYVDAGLVLNTNAFAYHSKTGDEMRAILKAITDNTAIDESDVTIFYYSGHGTDADDLEYRGALCGTDINVASDDVSLVTVDDVQGYLDSVPGTVVVILDSCLSGQFITAKSTSAGKRKAAVRAFNNAWVSQLSTSKATNFTAKALTDSKVSSKYKILTASEALEYSWGGGANDFGWFTYWAGMGLGRIPNTSTGSSAAGALKADANKDSAVTLQELYKYVSTNVAKEFDVVVQQHTQVWPANDPFAVLIK
jgi:uncharacterized protein YjdB